METMIWMRDLFVAGCAVLGGAITGFGGNSFAKPEPGPAWPGLEAAAVSGDSLMWGVLGGALALFGVARLVELIGNGRERG